MGSGPDRSWTSSNSNSRTRPDRCCSSLRTQTPDRHRISTRYAPGDAGERRGVHTRGDLGGHRGGEPRAGETAHRIFSKINPIDRGKKPDEYCAEPYVTPGNIEGPDSPLLRQGGLDLVHGFRRLAVQSRAGMDSRRACHVRRLARRPVHSPVVEGATPCAERSAELSMTSTVKNPQRGGWPGVAEVKVRRGRASVPHDGRPVNTSAVLSPATEHEIVIVLGGHA